MTASRTTAVRTAALLACAALCCLGAPAARAAIGSCTVSSSGVAFGTYTPLQGAPLQSNGTIDIACTAITGRTGITIDLSSGASGSYATRRMTVGASTLSYNLYFDAAYTQIWGNGTGGSVEGTARIRRRTPNVTLTVYGAVAAGQDPGPGGYTDSITVSVNY